MFELLAAFAFWPWAIFVCLLCFCSWAAWAETFVGALMCVVIYSIAVLFLYENGPIIWIINNPLKAFLGIILYGGIGAVWSLFKWRRKILKPSLQEELKSAKERFVRKNPNSNPAEYVNDLNFPRAANEWNNKDQITSWIALWPISIFVFFFDDIILRFFTRIYEMFSGLYRRITLKYIP